MTNEPWLPIPDHVAALLGRVTFYAAWLDDVLGDAVVLGNPGATDVPASTPGWADSGQRLVAAVRGIQIPAPYTFVGRIADELASLNATRNLLIHGVWLWKDGRVMVMKRSLDKTARLHEYLTFTYDEIVAVIDRYQRLGTMADRLVKALMENNPTHDAREEAHTPRCPTDATPMDVFVQDDDVIAWRCPACGLERATIPS